MTQYNESPFDWDYSLFGEEKNRVRQVNKDGKRHYIVEGKEEVPLYSITGVIGDDPKKKKAIHQWRKRVGEKEANRVSSFATKRGTSVHTVLEKYIKYGEQGIERETLMPHVLDVFQRAKNSLDHHIDLVYGLEERLFSFELGIAGTVDGIVRWNGVDSILDFKTSKRPKQKSKIEGYFQQTTGYSLMLEEMTGKSFDQIVVFIMNDEDDEPQVFVESREDWVPPLLKSIHGYHTRRDLLLPSVFRSVEGG